MVWNTKLIGKFDLFNHTRKTHKIRNCEYRLAGTESDSSASSLSESEADPVSLLNKSILWVHNPLETRFEIDLLVVNFKTGQSLLQNLLRIGYKTKETNSENDSETTEKTKGRERNTITSEIFFQWGMVACYRILPCKTNMLNFLSSAVKFRSGYPIDSFGNV